jgi:hypothetical protein
MDHTSGKSQIYISGEFTQGFLVVNHGNGTFAFNLTNGDMTTAGYVISYAFNGTALWALRVNGPGFEHIESVVESDQGNLYIMGALWNNGPMYV